MAALQQTVGGPSDPSPPPLSFAGALTAPITNTSAVPDHFFIPAAGLHKGFPAVNFTNDQLSAISKPFNWALIGKFSQGFNRQHPDRGRPSVEKLRDYFISLDLKGVFTIGLLDNRHLLIQLQTEEDYLRLYSRMVWYVGSVTMRIFKWSPFFHVDRESSVVPVWISMPRLPIQFFDKRSLFPIASLIGCPLRLDVATSTLKRPSVARVQIELDLLKPRPRQIWIGMGERDGFWQRVDYENVPSYCSICFHVGHADSLCRVQNLELQPPLKDGVQGEKPGIPSKPQKIYAEKPKQPTPSVADGLNKEKIGLVAVGIDSVVSPVVPDGSLLSNISIPLEDKLCPQPVRQNVTTPVSGEHVGILPIFKSPVGASTAVSDERNIDDDHQAAEAELSQLHAEAVGGAEAVRVPDAPKVVNGSCAAITPGALRQEANHVLPRSSPPVTMTSLLVPVLPSMPSLLSPILPSLISPSQPSLDSPAPPSLALTSSFSPAQPSFPSPSLLAPSLITPNPSSLILPSNIESSSQKECAPTSGASSHLSPESTFPKPRIFCGDDTPSNATPLSAQAPLIDTTAWHPQNQGKALSLTPTPFPTGRILPRSFDYPDEHSSWHTMDSAEEAADEDSGREDHMEDFLDSQYIRDDIYLEKRKNRQSRRDRDTVQMRRGRGRPIGSRTCPNFDVVHPMATRSKTVD